MVSITRNLFGCRSNQQPAPVAAKAVMTPGIGQRLANPLEHRAGTTSQQCLPTMNSPSTTLDSRVTTKNTQSTGIITRISDAVSNFFDFKTKFRNYFYSQCKGKEASRPEEINKAMRRVGAEPLTLKTSRDVETKGMHFTVEAFAKQMQEAGAQRVSLNRLDNHSAIPAIVLDNKNPNYQSMMDALDEMGFFAKDVLDNKGNLVKLSDGIWEKRVIDGRTYFWTKDNFAKMNGCFTNNCTRFNTSKVSVDTASLKPFSAKGEQTIVLNGGVYSRFESFRTASEVAKFLALGINVVVSEDKNPTVIDTESHENVMANREAIYNKLASMGLRNDQIIWKGTCFSSAPAVEAAAKYQGTHVIVDQGYVSAAEMVKKQLPTMMRPLSPLVRPAVKALDFNYEMESYLPQVKGCIAVISNNNDDKVPEGQVDRINRARGEHLPSFNINDLNVKHAGGWYNDAACNREFTAYLMNNQWSGGEIIG